MSAPFFRDLVTFMVSGPVVVQVLEGENAVARNREIMGATNPANAAPGTVRAEFAESIEANSVHGSDSAENAATEIAFFFAGSRSSAEGGGLGGRPHPALRATRSAAGERGARRSVRPGRAASSARITATAMTRAEGERGEGVPELLAIGEERVVGDGFEGRRLGHGVHRAGWLSGQRGYLGAVPPVPARG